MKNQRTAMQRERGLAQDFTDQAVLLKAIAWAYEFDRAAAFMEFL